MTNNDILRRIRYCFDFADVKLISIFEQGGEKVTREQVLAWLQKEDETDYKACNDKDMATFLNGLIIHNRGKREGEQPAAEKRLTNNLIFVKLKIALNLKAEAILELLNLAGFRISKHELSAFFRKPGHKHYRECKDQVLRNFLNGMQLHYRAGTETETGTGAETETSEPGKFEWPQNTQNSSSQKES